MLLQEVQDEPVDQLGFLHRRHVRGTGYDGELRVGQRGRESSAVLDLHGVITRGAESPPQGSLCDIQDQRPRPIRQGLRIHPAVLLNSGASRLASATPRSPSTSPGTASALQSYHTAASKVETSSVYVSEFDQRFLSRTRV